VRPNDDWKAMMINGQKSIFIRKLTAGGIDIATPAPA
jgi:hypothetical protein